MFCLVKIFEGNFANRLSDAFCFTVKDYKRVHGAFSSGGADLSIAFESGRKIFFRNLEQRTSTGFPPNKRPVFFEKVLDNEIISGVIAFTDNAKRPDNVSVYLLLS